MDKKKKFSYFFLLTVTALFLVLSGCLRSPAGGPEANPDANVTPRDNVVSPTEIILEMNETITPTLSGNNYANELPMINLSEISRMKKALFVIRSTAPNESLLYVFDAVKSKLLPFRNMFNAAFWDPKFSPDGKLIGALIYKDDKIRNKTLFIGEVETGNVRYISNSIDLADSDFDWLNDSRSVISSCWDGLSLFQPCVIDTVSGKVEKLGIVEPLNERVLKEGAIVSITHYYAFGGGGEFAFSGRDDICSFCEDDFFLASYNSSFKKVNFTPKSKNWASAYWKSGYLVINSYPRETQVYTQYNNFSQGTYFANGTLKSLILVKPRSGLSENISLDLLVKPAIKPNDDYLVTIATSDKAYQYDENRSGNPWYLVFINKSGDMEIVPIPLPLGIDGNVVLGDFGIEEPFVLKAE